jgi:hypothetical protein
MLETQQVLYAGLADAVIEVESHTVIEISMQRVHTAHMMGVKFIYDDN